MSFRLRAWSCLAFAAFVGPVGCGDDSDNMGTGFTTANVEEETTAEGGTTLNGDGDGDSGDGDGDSGDGDGDSGDGDGDSGDGDGDAGDGDGDSGDGDGDAGDGDGDPDMCPPEQGDDACTLCVKGSCCAEWLTCEADAECVCMSECIGGGGGNNQCKNMCDVQGANQNWNALGGCINDLCAADCGG
jgi:hypothetical protein